MFFGTQVQIVLGLQSTLELQFIMEQRFILTLEFYSIIVFRQWLIKLSNFNYDIFYDIFDDVNDITMDNDNNFECDLLNNEI